MEWLLNCNVLEVITNSDQIKHLLKRAYEILNGKMPDPNENCEFCRWAQITTEKNSLSGGKYNNQ